MSQDNPNKLKRECKLIKLSPWIILRLHLQPKFETKLATHFLIKGKMKILLKYLQDTG